MYPGVIESSDAELDTEVLLEGTAHTHDWKMLFALLGVDHEESLDTWIQAYRDESAKRLVSRMFEYFPERTFAYNHTVGIHVDDGVSVSLAIGFAALRLERGKETKDFLLCTAANVTALTAEGTRYPVTVLRDEPRSGA